MSNWFYLISSLFFLVAAVLFVVADPGSLSGVNLLGSIFFVLAAATGLATRRTPPGD